LDKNPALPPPGGKEEYQLISFREKMLKRERKKETLEEN
jgi:hypothetical protein